MQTAREYYAKWGAVSKVSYIDSLYGELLETCCGQAAAGEDAESRPASDDAIGLTGTGSLPDLYTLAESLQTISGEIVLEKVIDNVMGLIIANAGARRGVLLLSRNEELFAVAEGYAEAPPSVLARPVPLSEYDMLPQSIINYCRRTGEAVVLADALQEGIFSRDEYLQKKHSRSILCQPLVSQKKLKGIIFLENDLATGVFRSGQTEIVSLLSTQAAISLENAVLFERAVNAESEIQNQLEEMQGQYEELEAMNEELQRAYDELDSANSLLEEESRMLLIFRRMADSSVQGMVITDLEGMVVYMNTSVCSMAGVEDPEGMIGRSALDYFPEKTRGRFMEVIIPSVLEKGEWVEEIPMYKGRSTRIETIHTFFQLKGKDGEPLFFADIITDITNIREAENILRESEERYRMLVETMNDGLCILDNKGIFTFLNKSLCSMLGYSEAELVGKHITTLFDGENRNIFKNEFSKRGAGGNSIYEIEWITKDSGPLFTIISPKPVFDSEGNFTLSFGVITNITERKNAEREKEKIQAQLLHSQKMEAIGTLAGGIAHDFNNMLTSIYGNTGLLLLDMESDDPHYSLVSEIAAAAEKSASLTRQLLAFSRKQIIETSPIDLNSVILDMQNMLKRLIGEDVDLVVDLGPGAVVVEADKNQIEQIILNLSLNARDAMPEGGRLIISTAYGENENPVEPLSESHNREYVILKIEDNGQGMDSETLKNIFEPFFTTKETSKGTGLGLAVVYGIVKQHEGWVSVESRVGEGTCFKICLPAVSSSDSRALQREGKAPSGKQVYQRGSGERILLVEDQDDVRKFVKNALTGFGYSITEASDIKSAMSLFEAEEGNFSLLLSDVVLPDGKGTSLAESLIKKNPQLKIILSSGYTEQKFQLRIIQEKHYNYLPKPYTLNNLLDFVKKVIAGP